MKEVLIGETRVLLARTGDRFHAVSATCPHYGAPQEAGIPGVTFSPPARFGDYRHALNSVSVGSSALWGARADLLLSYA